MNLRDRVRRQAFEELQRAGVVLMSGHFDYGNGYHGRLYLNPHALFKSPSTIWRVAQDLIDVLPSSITGETDVVAGPVTGGALLAHTIAGLLDSRRSLTHPPCSFAPFNVDPSGGHTLRPFYQRLISGQRVLLADDVRNTGQTFKRCAALVEDAGGSVIATVCIYDRMEAVVDLGVPNIVLAEYRAPENYPAAACPLCEAGVPMTTF